MPIVSVCIPVYNSISTIQRTLSSVEQQSFSDLEIVIADNCSTDGTYEFLQAQKDSRIRLIRNERNIGMVANYHRVIQLSTGLFVKLLCADDVIYPHCISRQVTVFESLPYGVVITAGRRDILTASGRVLLYNRGLGGLEGRVPGDFVLRQILKTGSNPIGEGQSVLMRGDIARALPVSPANLPYLVDLSMWCAALRMGDLYADTTTMGDFRVSKDSESWNLRRSQRAQNSQFLKNLRNQLGDSRCHMYSGRFRYVLTATARAFLVWISDRV